MMISSKTSSSNSMNLSSISGHLDLLKKKYNKFANNNLKRKNQDGSVAIQPNSHNNKEINFKNS